MNPYSLAKELPYSSLPLEGGGSNYIPSPLEGEGKGEGDHPCLYYYETVNKYGTYEGSTCNTVGTRRVKEIFWFIRRKVERPDKQQKYCHSGLAGIFLCFISDRITAC